MARIDTNFGVYYAQYMGHDRTVLFSAAGDLRYASKGGEITPLFFMGATLGNTLAVWMGVPIDLFAGLGFIAVFAGFTRSPVSSTVMGLELFGLEYGIYFAVVCWVSVWVGGVFNFEVSKRS
jgi:H+/Cl- antiporter ClcA